jgi:hypothetical protein
MPQHDSQSSAGSASSSQPKSGVQTRIDPAHTIAGGPSRPEASPEREGAAITSTVEIASVDGADTPRLDEQLRLQAEQISTYLRAQQKQVDRREAHLHAQLAQQDNGARSARLWFRERQQELTEREAELRRREQEVEREQARWKRREQQQTEAGQRIESEDTVAQGQFDRQHASVLGMVRRFLRGEALPAEASEAMQSGGAAATSAADHDAVALGDELLALLKQLRLRQQNLEEAEALLADGQSALDAGRKQLAADRADWEQRCEVEHRQAAETRRRAELELDKKLRSLQTRGDHLERRSAAVDQLRAETLHAQREALELRLATDETWAQMVGGAPPAILTQSMARIRSKLADEYRLERAGIAGQQKELEGLVARLNDQHDKLQRQKQELEQWAADRRAEIEGQAARLVAREQELDLRQGELDQLRADQQGERRVYEGEIRRLLGQLRRSDSPAQAA